jgi:hypothetical protein
MRVSVRKGTRLGLREKAALPSSRKFRAASSTSSLLFLLLSDIVNKNLLQKGVRTRLEKQLLLTEQK